jgi:hypothetical protein
MFYARTRALDPDSLNPYTDPDPVFQLNPDPIRIQGFYDQKLKKKDNRKLVFIFFRSKIATLCPSYRRSRQPSKENIQHFKT